MSQPNTSPWLDAFLDSEEETIRHMGRRAVARLIAFASYHMPVEERVEILDVAIDRGYPAVSVLSVWCDLSELEVSAARIAA